MIINGKKLAEEILLKLKKEMAALAATPPPKLRKSSIHSIEGGVIAKAIKKLPRLTIGAVLVGDSPASISFLNQKAKAAKFLGIEFKLFKFSAEIKTQKLLKEIAKLNRNKKINGFIIQLPLPKRINENLVLKAIDSSKDIDALSSHSLVLAPTVEAVKYVFQKYKIKHKTKKVLIIGKGRLVGKPIFKWLARQSENVVAIDEKQKRQLKKYTQEADIIISGVGKAGLVKSGMIKEDTILIDFGFEKNKGKMSGDFDFKSCAKKAKLITPVPGGMGPIMVAMLFKNFLKLNRK